MNTTGRSKWRRLLLISALAVVAFISVINTRQEIAPLPSESNARVSRSEETSLKAVWDLDRASRSPMPNADVHPPRTGAPVKVKLMAAGRTPVAAARVTLQSRGGVSETELTDTSGLAVFDDVPAGTWVPSIDAQSLTNRLAVPKAQLSKEMFGLAQPDPSYAIHHDGVHESIGTISIPEIAVISGVVRDPSGAFTDRAFVRIIPSIPDATIPSIDVDVKADGSFSCGVYAGKWIVQAIPGMTKGAWARVRSGAVSALAPSHGLEGAHPPIPAIVRIGEGEHKTIDLAFAVGNARIVGRMIDQKGASFAGLELFLRYAEVPEEDGEAFDPGFHGIVANATTESDGAFAFDRLLAGRYKVMLPPEGYNSCALPKTKALGRIPVEFGVFASGGISDLGVIVVDRSAPVLVRGQVQINKEWIAGRTITPDRIAASLVFRSERTSRDVRCDATVDASGIVSGYVERLIPNVLLELRWGDEVLMIPIDQSAADESLWFGIVIFPNP